MASTSCASHLSNTRVPSWLPSPDKVQGRVTFISLRPRKGFRTQATLMAAGPSSSSSSSKALVFDSPFHGIFPVEERKADQEKRGTITNENLDEWIKDSVSEIVKNIGEAPFLVQIFARGDKRNGVIVEREAATPDTWPRIENRWARQNYPIPDGIILVDELRKDLEEELEGQHEDGPGQVVGSDNGPANKSHRAWGLLVQGRGMECVACYVLNTCRVLSPAGSCTHFCLARAECFGGPIELQMRNAWLQSRR